MVEDGAKRAALYVRVSTDEQAEHGYSVPDQERELRDHAQREGYTIVEVIVDDGYSGAVGVRPGLTRVAELAEAGEIDVVLAKKRNRFFRDRYIRMGFERSMQEYGVKLVALDDAGHRFADAVMDEFSDWYREEVARNTVAGRMEKARQGRLIRTHTPIYGFRYTDDGEAFVIVPERMEIVERIVREMAEGRTTFSIKRGLERDRVPTPKGAPLWREKTVRDIVFEDAYRPVHYEELVPMLSAEAVSRLDPEGEYGIVWYPRNKVTFLEPDPTNGYRRPQRVVPRSREEQVPIPVVSSGIPRELIDRARETVREKAENRVLPARTLSDKVYELRSIVRCARCGRLMASNTKKPRKKVFHYYRCPSYQRDGLEACTMNRAFRAETTERAVLTAVLDAVKDKEVLIQKAEESYEEQRRALIASGATDTAYYERRLDELEGERLEFFRQAARGRLPDEQLDALLAENEKEKERLEQTLEENEKREKREKDLVRQRDKTISLIRQEKWHELGITAPEARNERYREIGLSAWCDRDGTIRLQWGVGDEAVVWAQTNPMSGVGA